jgi:uncharacterized protein
MSSSSSTTPQADAAPALPPLVRRTVQRLIAAFAPERIVLFGSYANGAAHGRSDVDLLVVADAAAGAERALRRARQLAADCFPRVDVVMATPADVAEAATAPSPFLASVLETGITLYERPAAVAVREWRSA